MEGPTVSQDDVILTFNYDVSLERELTKFAKWDIRTGYGFPVAGNGGQSLVTLLKLHGSTNWTWLPADGSSNPGSSGAISIPLLHSCPSIAPEEFCFLGYASLQDPEYVSHHLMINGFILPYLRKEFYAGSSLGREGISFWNSLWDKGAVALERAQEVVILGYSMPIADCRARNLIFSRANRTVPVTVCSGNDTDSVCNLLHERRFASVRPANVRRFEEFVKEHEYDCE